MSRRANGEGTIYQRKDGRWMARAYVYDREGGRVRRAVYGKTREEVADKLVELQALTRKHIPAAPEKHTVRTYGAEWLARLQAGRTRPATVQYYTWVLEKFVYDAIGNVRLTALTPDHIRKVMAKTAASRRTRKDGRTGAPLSARTVQMSRNVLRAMLQEAMRDEIVHRNVAALVRSPRIERHEVDPWTPKEVEKFLAATKGHRLGALFSVGVALGMRKGELLALRWGDVDLGDQTLRVRATLQRLGGGQGIVTGMPKTLRSGRTVPLPGSCVVTLREHWERQEREREAAGDAWQDHRFVFTARNGNHLEPRNVNRLFDQLQEKAGVRRIRFHDLRHTCATLLLAQGVTPRTVMEVLGHSQMSITTDLYGHVMPSTLRDAADAMDAVLRT